MNARAVLATALMLAACAPAPEPDLAPRAVAESFGQALQSGDRAAALALLAPDVVIYEFGGVEASRDAYAASHLKADMEFLAAANVQVLDQQQAIDDGIAVVTTRTRVKATWQGKAIDSFGTETMVLRREGGRWLISHIHWSSRAAPTPENPPPG